MRRQRRRLVGTALVALAAVGVTAGLATTSTAASKATPIKVGILSDCEGAFGAFHGQDVGGAIAAFSEFTGAKPKNPDNPIAGMTGGTIAGHPIKIVGIGCSNDRADRAISETRRLVEQLGADVQIGPLSGDEGIAVANYAKAHPRKTFVNGVSGAQDTTLKVRAPNFFRFNGDGAQWNAGIGDLAYNKLGWRKAAAIADDYSFAWTSIAGPIAEFCANGGQITKRVFPPLNTTDYSTYVRQLPPPNKVDGYFWAIGGSGTIPALKAFEQAFGPIKASQHTGNMFWDTPGTFKELGTRVAGVYAGGSGAAPDLTTPRAKWYVGVIGKWFEKFPPLPGTAASQAASLFTYNYFNNTWGLIKGLQAVKGDLSGGQKKLQAALGKVVLNAGYGPISLDKNRNGVMNEWVEQLYTDKTGALNVRTVLQIPNTDQTFGGTFSESTPSPSRTVPACKKRAISWLSKEKMVINGKVGGTVDWKKLP